MSKTLRVTRQILAPRPGCPMAGVGTSVTVEALSDNPGRVDVESGTIRDCRIVGLQSVNRGRMLGVPAGIPAANNPYRYDESALAESVPQYEGCRVFLDHPPNEFDASGKRTGPGNKSVRDLFGRLVNVRFVPGDGLRGDIEFLRTHSESGTVCEAADRMPATIALSHRTESAYEIIGQEAVIKEIRRVFSVDLIAESPGTTVSIFESEVADMANEACKTREDDMLPETVEPQPDAEANPGDTVNDGIVAAVCQIILGEGTAADKLPKIQALLEQMDAIAGVLSPEAPAEEEAEQVPAEDKPAEEPAKEAPAMESAKYDATIAAISKLEQASVKATLIRIQTLAAVSESAHDGLIAEFKAADKSVAAPVPPSVPNNPKAGEGKRAASPVAESRYQQPVSTDAESYKKRLQQVRG